MKTAYYTTILLKKDRGILIPYNFMGNNLKAQHVK